MYLFLVVQVDTFDYEKRLEVQLACPDGKVYGHAYNEDGEEIVGPQVTEGRSIAFDDPFDVNMLQISKQSE